MRAMVLHAISAAEREPLRLDCVAAPEPRPGEVLIDVAACGVCRTDLHVVEGELGPPRLPLIPGHEAVGRVAKVGEGVHGLRPGDRVGVAWVHRFCGQCDMCVDGRENLCREPTFTGYHVDGGYAQRIVADARFVHPIPPELGDDASVAPLLCAGIIGYRALKASGLIPGARLALYGFGGSAHIALQVATAWGCETFVVTRDEDGLRRARTLGASWAGKPGEALPTAVDHAVSFAPAGSVIPGALAGLRPGGTLALAGIYVDRVPALDYEAHLFQERRLVSVTANTRRDARELLQLAARLGVRTDVRPFPLESANEALALLKAGRLGASAAVLVVGG